VKTIEQVCRQLARGRFDFTVHAFRRAVERNISERELREAGGCTECIELYPDDKYAQSPLLLGFTNSARPLHIQVSLADASDARIITLYEPSAGEWDDNRRRR
jgi:hypothetical protein